MRKFLLMLLICCSSFSSIAQSSWNTLYYSSAVKVESAEIYCGTSWYEALKLHNQTDSIITISFNIEQYWVFNPATATTIDSTFTYTLNPYQKYHGDCLNTELMVRTRPLQTDSRISRIQILNMEIE